MVFDHLKQLWMGIWQHTHTVTTAEVSPDLGEFTEIPNDVSVKMIPLCYHWGCRTFQTASHIYVIHILGVEWSASVRVRVKDYGKINKRYKRHWSGRHTHRRKSEGRSDIQLFSLANIGVKRRCHSVIPMCQCSCRGNCKSDACQGALVSIDATVGSWAGLSHVCEHMVRELWYVHKQINKDHKACKHMICLWARGWQRYHMFMRHTTFYPFYS